MSNLLNQALILPCGVRLKNRIAKSAMSENMATTSHESNVKFDRLYKRWAKGGTGLVISGNIMVDRRALGEPNNIVIEAGMNLEAIRSWTKAGTENETALWAQLNHPGKQSPRFLSKEPLAPSAIALKPPLDRLFACPRALQETEIQGIISRFAFAAKAAKDLGFTGVQIHGAHGYLVSQFLSPQHNTREDAWGGSLPNRMRFVVEVYQAIRSAVGPEFPVGIKLNSADFQRGGFSEDESIEVAKTLSELKIDLIEISGGTYESQAMIGKKQKKSTLEREAYFLDYCERIRKSVKTPLLLTGGFRTLTGMNAALGSGACDLIGLARSLALDPDFSNDLLQGHATLSQVHPLTTGVKALDHSFPIEITWYTDQLHRMGKGKNPDPHRAVIRSILSTMLDTGIAGLRRVRF